MLINFYKLREEATNEAIKKYNIECKPKFLNILYSCIYDMVVHKVVCTENSYIVYMRNSYFNIEWDCVTILKEFTTKPMRGNGLMKRLKNKLTYSTVLEVNNEKKPNTIGYINSL